MNITLELKKVALAASIALIAAPAFAQTTATTDPVGFVTQTLAANADSYIYIPFKRNPDFAGATSGAVSGAGNNVVTAASSTWTVDQFALNSTNLKPRYYALIRSGAKAGMFYTITNNTANTLTLDLAGDSISAGVVSGTTFQVCAYDTLGSIFPSGSGVNGSATHSLGARQTEVFLPDQVTTGVDLAPAASYYYFTGAGQGGPGWRKAGAISTIVNDEVLYPDNYFIVRHNVATATSLTQMGTVQIGQVQLPLSTLAAGENQDIAVAIPVPASLSLTQSNLFESGAFAGSSSHSLGSRKDELYVWDNAVVATSKSPDLQYYYFTGAGQGGPGWRKAGDINTIRNSEVVIAPGKTIAIRKKTLGAPSTTFWTVTPSNTYAP